MEDEPPGNTRGPAPNPRKQYFVFDERGYRARGLGPAWHGQDRRPIDPALPVREGYQDQRDRLQDMLMPDLFRRPEVRPPPAEYARRRVRDPSET